MKDITSIEQTDDTTLWHLLIQGDRKALEVIYQRYYVLLLNYGLKCTSDRELIKDCIHDLFVYLYHNTRISIEGITVRAYLLRALKNSLFNKLVGLERERDSLDTSSFEIPTDEDLFEQMFPQNDRDFAPILAESHRAAASTPEDSPLPALRQGAFAQRNSGHHGDQRTVVHESDQPRPAQASFPDGERRYDLGRMPDHPLAEIVLGSGLKAS